MARFLRSIQFFVILLLLLPGILSGTAVFAGNRSASAPAFTAEERSYLKSRGPIVFVSQSSYPPFEFRQKDGTMDGICIELARWMSTETGVQARFVSMSFEAAQQAVLSGSADVITSLFYSDKRAVSFSFSEPVFDVPASIFVKADRPDITRLADLNGKRIAIQRGDYATEFLESKGIRFELIPTENFAEATEAVLAGRADALIGDEQIVLYYLYRNRLTELAKMVGEPLYVGKNCMATRKGNPLLASILAKSLKHAQDAGVMDSVSRKWLGTGLVQHQGLLERITPYLITISLVGLAGTVLVVIWSIQLRNRVEERTQELTDGKLELRTLVEQLSMTNSRLEESDARLRGITESARDAILMIDPQGAISFWNPAAETILGYSGSEVLGKKLHEVLAPSRYWDAHRAAFANFVRTGCGKAVGTTLELEAVRKDGKEIPVSISLSAVLLDGGWHAVGIMRDITEYKQYEAELKTARQAAEAANQAKSEFLANMSHEIRTPMNGVLGMTELLGFTGLTQKQEEYLDCIKSSGDSLLALINDILDLSKIEAGKIELEYADFSLPDALKDVINLQLANIHRKQLQYTLELPDDLPVVVQGDQLRFKQILLNLLSNAIKFTEQGRIIIGCCLLERQQSGVFVRITVKDTGIGMTA